MNQSRNRKRGLMRQVNEIQNAFTQFVLDDQYVQLLENYKLKNIQREEWDEQIILYYDLIIDYFLKNYHSPSIDIKQWVNRADIRNKYQYQKLIVIEDDQLRLELKQYFFINPIELQVVMLENDQINKSQIQSTYNRQINVAGFILKTPLGYIKKQEFIPHSNIMLNFYSKQNDMFNKYSDNRVQVVKILLDYFRLKTHLNILKKLWSQSCMIEEIQDIQQIYMSKQSQSEPLSDIIVQFMKRFGNILGIDWEQQTNDQVLQFIQEKHLFDEFIRFIGYFERKKLNEFEMNIQYDQQIPIQKIILYQQNVDQQYDLRMLQYIFKKTFGLNLQVKKAKTVQDFYTALPSNLVTIMQEKLNIHKNQKSIICTHIDQLQKIQNFNNIDSLKNLIHLITQTLQQPTEQNVQSIQLHLFSNVDQKTEYTFNFIYDMATCNQCQNPIICYHQILQYLLKYEQITLDIYDQLIQPFLQRDLSIFTQNSFCSVCGSAFPIKVELQQIYENLDPLKKYNSIKKTFKMLYNAIIMPFQIPVSYFIYDFIQQYYYTLKQELVAFKEQVNYLKRKQEIIILFVIAYFQSIKSENFLIDLKLMYKYSQQKDIGLVQFLQQVQQIQNKFKLQSSIVIPSLTTIKHLYQCQFYRPIIGFKIQQNPSILSNLLKSNLPMYPYLYELDKYLQYFNSNIETLSQDVINAVIETSAVNISNRPSTVVQVYQQIKNTYGKAMERNTSKLSQQQYKKGSYIFTQIPKEYCILNTKDLFYKKYCFKTKTMHETNKSCKYCGQTTKGSIDIQKISDKQYVLDFFKINQLTQKQEYKYPEIDDKLAFPLDYSNKYLYNISKELGVLYFQIVNLGGFSYLDLNNITQFKQIQQLVEYQLKQFGEISKIPTYQHMISNKYIPKDLAFIYEYKSNYNFNLFNTRLTYIKARINYLLANVGETSLILDITKDFNQRCFKQLQQGNVTSNRFIDCQLTISYFFVNIYPQLKKIVNSSVLQQQLSQMFKDDLLIRDSQTELGAFRLKTSKQVIAEAAYEQFLAQRKTISPQDIDEDNDYVDALKKNTLDDITYEEEFDQDNEDQFEDISQTD